MGTKENTAVTKKVQTYQNFITVINMKISRKPFGRESVKKRQKTTRTKITRRNVIIAKWIITKKIIATRRRERKNNLQTTPQNN